MPPKHAFGLGISYVLTPHGAGLDPPRGPLGAGEVSAVHRGGRGLRRVEVRPAGHVVFGLPLEDGDYGAWKGFRTSGSRGRYGNG